MMNDYSKINKFLCEKTIVKEAQIVNMTYKVKNLSFMRIRDILYGLGTIYFEDLAESMYFAVLPGGFMKKNNVYTAVELNADMLKIALFANEGIIKQHTCEGALNGIERQLKDYICQE